MDIWVRVLMALVLVFAPSILFVLLYRGLVRLQDQELIARLAEAGHLDPASVEAIQDSPRGGRETDDERGGRLDALDRNAVNERRAAFLREYGGPESRSTAAHRSASQRDRRDQPAHEAIGAREVVRCPECGTENAAEFGLCWNCLEWLD